MPCHAIDVNTSSYSFNSFDFFQGGQDILSMMGQLMKPKKTEITGAVQIMQWHGKMKGLPWQPFLGHLPLAPVTHIHTHISHTHTLSGE